jgi:hypothetical protein
MRNSESAPHEHILAIILGFWKAHALGLATKLGLPEFLADGPLHVDELAGRTETNPSALFRLLRALESTGIFIQVSPLVFGNTPASECLRESVPGSQRALVLQNLSIGNGAFEGWAQLEYSVRTGEPSVDKIYGYGYWELLRRNPEANEANNAAMRSASVAMTPAVTAAYDWSQFRLIADVGGGIGTQLVSILDASPSSKGILFDQPHLHAESISHDRMNAVGGDFFASVPADADAYLLRWVLHDWTDTEARAILRTLRRSMKPTARLIVAESVIPQGAAFDFGKWADLQMLVLVGGRERTETEFRDLLLAAGFGLQNVLATASPLSLLVAKPM